ncbi:ABC transporter ATP-binding protein [Klebsiella aerogenes]|nr:ABC transporter ATP-binding protein [Klebsiella aerogenes]
MIGNNGAGKSTLLKLLSRVTRPSSGRIQVNGRLSSLLEVGAGFHHDLSGRENIYLAGAIMGMSPRDIRQKMDRIVAFSGIDAFLEQPTRTYSSGMFLRLAFSVGIHLDTDILVIDEALAVGDRTFRARCLERIHTFRRHGGTLVLVSHDPHQLVTVCDTGMVLSHGRLQYFGDIHSALAHSDSHKEN